MSQETTKDIMCDRLTVIKRNLAVLGSLQENQKIQIKECCDTSPGAKQSREETRKAFEGEAADAPKASTASIFTHHMCIDERWLQGPRRSISGDGHAVTIAFIRHVCAEVMALANQANEQIMKGHITSLSSDMFEKTPRRMLQELSDAMMNAETGVDQLKQTTYAYSMQLRTDLASLGKEIRDHRTCIVGYLSRQPEDSRDFSAPLPAPLTYDEKYKRGRRC